MKLGPGLRLCVITKEELPIHVVAAQQAYWDLDASACKDLSKSLKLDLAGAVALFGAFAAGRRFSPIQTAVMLVGMGLGWVYHHVPYLFQ